MFDVLEEVKSIEKDIINWRRELHKIPELGLELPKTSKFVQDRLKEMDIEYKTLVNGNAIVGLIQGDLGEGKTLALRADMDGLPIKEETDFEFKSQNENMHACGHDSHTAMLLGVAKVLSSNRDRFRGNVKLIFQPGEEYPGGAKPMLDEGAFENPKVDGVLGLHAGQISKEVTKGQIGISYGPMMASMDRVFIKVIGKGGHGAYPQECIDPVVMAAEIILSVQKIVSREVPPYEPAVVSLCRVEGGYNQNIIPDTVELEGTIRTFNNDLRKKISERIEEIVKGVTDSNGANYEYEYNFKYPPVVNDEEFTKNLVQSAKKVIDSKDIVEIDHPLMGGEDFAYYLEEVPGTFIFLSNLLEVDGQAYGHHTSKFALDESEFFKGTSIFVQFALDYLNE
ncbi:M20 metallopeptidase family protein [Anaerosphaera multitolerans]|uniref:Amidohydrolase n=1 Tax=Anaerosphaera multitolerans TaxID=2487351 RepID=A0A437S499_9FIRM|nr:M20 family metallopeptidase [Anaerosphaera multitolerans]RVU53855.1 amidohydrolase [Anaerosphaera multitolerans]